MGKCDDIVMVIEIDLSAKFCRPPQKKTFVNSNFYLNFTSTKKKGAVCQGLPRIRPIQSVVAYLELH